MDLHRVVLIKLTSLLKVSYKLRSKMDTVKRIKSLFKKKKCVSILKLNQDFLYHILQYCDRADLLNVNTIRNFQIRDGGERIYMQKYGKSVEVSKEHINSESVKTWKIFGHLIKKMVLVFRQNEIGRILEFIEKNVTYKNLVELEIRHLPDQNPSGR